MTFLNRFGKTGRTVLAGSTLVLALWVGATALSAKPATTVSGKAFSAVDALPAKCLFRLSFDGLEAGAQCKNTAIAQIWNDPQMQAFADPIKKMVEGMTADMGDEIKREFGLSIDDVRGLMKNGMTVQLNDFVMGENGPESFDATLAVDLGGKKEAMQKLGDLIEKAVQKNTDAAPATVDIAGHQAWTFDLNGQKVAWTFAETTLLAGTNLETLAGILNRMKAQGGAGGIAENAEYVKVSKKIAPARPAMASVFVDVHGIVEKVMKKTSGSGEVNALVSGIGLDAIGGVGYALSQEGAGFTDRVYISNLPGKTSIYSAGKHSNDPLRTLAMAPEKSYFYGASRSDFGGLITRMLDAVTSADPDAASELKSFESNLEEKIGLSLRKDILPTLGTEMGFWAAPAPFGGMLPEIGIALELRDPKKFEECMATMTAKLGPDSGLRSFMFQGSKIGYVNTGIFFNAPGAFGAGPKPAWTVDGNFLMIGITPQTLKNSIIARRGQRAALTANRDFNNGMAQLKSANPNAGLDGSGYVDIGGLLVMFADTIGHAGQCVNIPDNMPIDMTLFPTTDVFSRYLFGLTSSSTFDADGSTLFEMYSPMGYVPTLTMTVAPIAAFGVMASKRDMSMEPMPVPPAEEEGDDNGVKKEDDGNHK